MSNTNLALFKLAVIYLRAQIDGATMQPPSEKGKHAPVVTRPKDTGKSERYNYKTPDPYAEGWDAHAALTEWRLKHGTAIEPHNPYSQAMDFYNHFQWQKGYNAYTNWGA